MRILATLAAHYGERILNPVAEETRSANARIDHLTGRSGAPVVSSVTAMSSSAPSMILGSGTRLCEYPDADRNGEGDEKRLDAGRSVFEVGRQRGGRLGARGVSSAGIPRRLRVVYSAPAERQGGARAFRLAP